MSLPSARWREECRDRRQGPPRCYLVGHDDTRMPSRPPSAASVTPGRAPAEAGSAPAGNAGIMAAAWPAMARPPARSKPIRGRGPAAPSAYEGSLEPRRLRYAMPISATPTLRPTARQCRMPNGRMRNPRHASADLDGSRQASADLDGSRQASADLDGKTTCLLHPIFTRTCQPAGVGIRRRQDQVTSLPATESHPSRMIDLGKDGVNRWAVLWSEHSARGRPVASVFGEKRGRVTYRVYRCSNVALCGLATIGSECELASPGWRRCGPGRRMAVLRCRCTGGSAWQGIRPIRASRATPAGAGTGFRHYAADGDVIRQAPGAADRAGGVNLLCERAGRTGGTIAALAAGGWHERAAPSPLSWPSIAAVW
jgi:hypothetical protein